MPIQPVTPDAYGKAGNGAAEIVTSCHPLHPVDTLDLPYP